MKMRIIRFDENVEIPTRKHYNDAGLDCYCPADIIIKSSEPVKIPLGFGLDIPDGYVVIIKPRSSMNCKGIVTYEGIIDSGYQGEISAVFSNITFKSIKFNKGDRICQLIMVPIAVCDLVGSLGDERLDKGFGSSGK